MAAPRVLVGLHESFWGKIGEVFSEYSVHFVRQDYKHFRDVPSDLGDTSQVEIYVGQPYIISQLIKDGKVPNLQWLQTSTSGNEILFEVLPKKKCPKFLVSRFPLTFPEAIADYVLGMIIACGRRFFFYHSKQAQNQFDPIVSDNSGLIREKKVLILGIGEVGQCVSKLCRAAGMYVIGVKRSSGISTQQLESVDEYRQINDLDEVLGRCDVIVNILPSSPATAGLLGGQTLSACKQKPLFINVGRGDVISDGDVLSALSNGWVSQAVLDVFLTEPLPPDSPLWTHPDVIITPHISGRTAQPKIVEQFSLFVSDNLNRFKAGESLRGLVDISQGY